MFRQLFFLMVIFASCTNETDEKAVNKSGKDTVYIHVRDTVLVKNERTRAYATFAGEYDGSVSMQKFFSEKRLHVSEPELMITSFRVSMVIHGVPVAIDCQGDSISHRAWEALREGVPGWQVCFNRIRACGRNGDTVTLSPVVIKLDNDVPPN